jgi:hypothetical protein
MTSYATALTGLEIKTFFEAQIAAANGNPQAIQAVFDFFNNQQSEFLEQVQASL